MDARPLLSFNAGMGRQFPPPQQEDIRARDAMGAAPWSSEQSHSHLNNFPVPPQHSRVLHTPPQQDRMRNDRMQNDRIRDDIMQNNRMQNDRMQNNRMQNDHMQNNRTQNDRMQGNHTPNDRVQTDRMQNNRMQIDRMHGGINQSTGGFGMQGGNQNNRRGQEQPPWLNKSDSQQPAPHKPPGLFDKVIPAPNNYHDNPPFEVQLKQEQSQISDSNVRSGANVTQPGKLNNLRDDPSLEEKALQAEVSPEYYGNVMALSSSASSSVIDKLALEYARQQYWVARGDNTNFKLIGKGNWLCEYCNTAFRTQNQLNNHCKSASHKDLEDLYQLKRQQAKLIVSKKMPHPKNKPNSDMVAVARAEVEMNLKPTSMELDAYILGIYESVMKSYWPVPKSTYYCRICNYKEFRSSSECEHHTQGGEHKMMQDNYGIAFCLFCQIHNKDSKKMSEHQKTERHLKIKTLMEKTKACAIEHWHKVNDLVLPEKSANSTVGNKRSGSELDPTFTSPLKKLSVSSPKTEVKKYGMSRSRTDNKGVASSNKTDSEDRRSPFKSTGKEEPKSADVSSSKSDAKAPTKDNEKEEMWYVPISGFMCVACQKFISDESEQKTHSKESSHTANVTKFKKLLSS